MYYLYAKNNIWNAFVLSYLCGLEQQLIIYSTFLNLFFSPSINGPSLKKTTVTSQ